MDTWTGNSKHKESNRSHQEYRSSLVHSSSGGHELSPHASHPPWTKLEARFRKAFGMNPVAKQMYGVHSVVAYVPYKSPHREGSKPSTRMSGKIFRINFLFQVPPIKLTRIAAWRARAISLSCSNRGLLPRISGSQNWLTAPLIWVIFP